MQVIPLLRRAAAAEAAMWRSLYAWLRRKPPTTAPGDEAFGYLGVVKPMLIVFIVLSAVEIPIVDLIIRHVVPWRPAHGIALGLGAWGLLWMIGVFAGLRVHPHLVGAAGIRVRMGARIDVTLDWADVDTVTRSYRSPPSSRSVQVEREGDRTVLSVVVGGQTSVDIRLRRPVTVRLPQGPSEPADELRLYADDPDEFVRACRRLAAADRATMPHAQEG